MTFRELHHTGATIARRAARDGKPLRHRMGHERFATTAQIYQHPDVEDQAAIADLFDDLFAHVG